ncbi:SDR family oxidoreductase [Rhizobium sp. FKY42]|uniref:SDR family NAD(P)-dependent oxidoreductase n=1 Tax=Rhizobium sp. FKY42 TaxID=2562310 RepID=UPI0010C12A40|nr:SDR family oxidoreductase [Rhizobium sp. FKY42]
MGELTGKVVLVTGGAAGIGEAVVLAAAREGARVAILDRDGRAAEALAAQINGARAFGADVTDFNALKAICAQIAAEMGGINGAVLNAGGALGRAPLMDCTPEFFAAVIGVNLVGCFNSIKAVLPHMLESGGSIVTMASLAGVLAEPAMPAYIAAKHGIVGLTKSVAVDYGRQGIRCNAVCPGFVRTPGTEHLFADQGFVQMLNSLHPIGRIVTAQEVAEACAFLLSDRASGMTGSTHLLDGGLAVN